MSPANTAKPAWTTADLRTNPHQHADKSGKVRGMFASIAKSYDLNNRLHALWMDVLWRNHAVRAADLKWGNRVLDVACGTGDLTQAFARREEPSRVVGLDFTREMLDLARFKRHRQPMNAKMKIDYIDGDAQSLPFEDASFDVLSIAFGIRNVQSPKRAIAEFARVLRPGGRLIILEFDRPKIAPVRWFNDFYAGWLMPRTATIIAGDRSGAYRYLPKSVAGFMKREELATLLEQNGFRTPRIDTLSLGICACYRALRTEA